LELLTYVRDLKPCFPCEAYAYGKNYNTFSMPAFPSWSACFYRLCSCDACILHMPRIIVLAFLFPLPNSKGDCRLLRSRLLFFNLNYLLISVTTPAPTVRPPSRIAKRSSLSIAIGVINVTSIAMLSPGITISVPSGNLTEPVTSVVRK